MDRIQGETFRNVLIYSIQVQVAKKPYWINVNYTANGAGQNGARLHACKKFSKKAAVRDGILPFCKELDVRIKHCDTDHELNARSMEAEFQPFSVDTPQTMKQNDLPTPPPGPKYIMSAVRQEILKKLKSAIDSGNFSDLILHHTIEMHYDQTKTFVKVSNLSPYQIAKAIKKSSSLYTYYEALQVFNATPTTAVTLACKGSLKYSNRHMWRLVASFQQNNYTLAADSTGKHERKWLAKYDDTWGLDLRDYIRESSVTKGRPNMTVAKFREYVNAVILPAVIEAGDQDGLPTSILAKGISIYAARNWLHYLGCFFKNGNKDVYYDGHEREDVVEYREAFIPRFLSYFEDPQVVVVVQDEVIYKAHEYNPRFWHCPSNLRTGEMRNNVMRKKGGGYGVMLSGFITMDGFIGLTDAEMAELNATRASQGKEPISMVFRLTNEDADGHLGDVDALTFPYYFFEYGKQREGYWNSEKMILQIKDVIALLEKKYPEKKLVFLFDWSSGHGKKPADSVLLEKMNKTWGGAQPAMRSVTILQDFKPSQPGGRALKKGDTQHLVFQPNDPPPFYDPSAVDYVGKPKGSLQVAFERGLWQAGMVKFDEENPERSLFHVLQNCADFQLMVKSQLQEEIEACGHVCDFLPKFHCELSAIERVWSKSKRYTHDNADDTRATLLKNIPISFTSANLTVEEIRNYFGRTVRYAERYLAGDNILLAEAAIKKSSHRTVSWLK